MELILLYKKDAYSLCLELNKLELFLVIISAAEVFLVSISVFYLEPPVDKFINTKLFRSEFKPGLVFSTFYAILSLIESTPGRLSFVLIDTEII